MKPVPSLLFSFVGWSSFSDEVRIDPAYLDHGVYHEQTDHADVIQIEGAGTAPCSRYTPIGVPCYCNHGVRRGHPVPGWTLSGGDLTNDSRGHYMRPGWHVSAVKGMHGSMKFCFRDQ